MYRKNKIQSIGVIGTGNLGTALAVNLSRAGYKITGISSRHYSSTSQLAGSIPGAIPCERNQDVADLASLVFIATPDSVIEAVCHGINWKTGQMVVHTSGAFSRELLTSAASAGALTGVFHPLQTVTPLARNPFLKTTFTIEANEPLRGVLKEIAHSLGGTGIDYSFDSRELYHASAVIASNYAVTLFDVATRIWQQAGYSREQASQALLPLLKGTVANLECIGLPDALTGPISRGDDHTVSRHVEALDKFDPSISETYKNLGMQTLSTAIEKGKIDRDKAARIGKLLNGR